MIIAAGSFGCNRNSEIESENANSQVKGFQFLNEATINEKGVMQIIESLTSEKYDGRLSGSEGNRLAVEYIAEYFRGLGLENPVGVVDYKQSFSHYVTINNEAPTLRLLNDSGNLMKDYEYIYDFSPTVYMSGSRSNGEVTAKTVLIGQIEDLHSDKGQLKDKIIVIPQEVLIESGTQKVFTKALSPDLGIAGIIYEVRLNGDIDYFPVAPNARPGGNGNSQDGPLVFRCEGDAFSDLIQSIGKDDSIQMNMDFSIQEVNSANVIGLIPGTDDSLKDEYIIICGHMDHVGNNKNGTYNPGALDNASGTASVMEVARILAHSKTKPKKSILFIAFNGEEEGIYGSDYYVRNPIYPLDNTTVINLDMVGSKGVIPLEVASANDKDSVLQNDLSKYCDILGIDYYKSVSQGSDHAPFGNRGVDAVLLIHYDKLSGYHSPSDTIESVDADRIKEVIKLVLYYLDKKAY